MFRAACNALNAHKSSTSASTSNLQALPGTSASTSSERHPFKNWNRSRTKSKKLRLNLPRIRLKQKSTNSAFWLECWLHCRFSSWLTNGWRRRSGICFSRTHIIWHVLFGTAFCSSHKFNLYYWFCSASPWSRSGVITLKKSASWIKCTTYCDSKLPLWRRNKNS